MKMKFMPVLMQYLLEFQPKIKPKSKAARDEKVKKETKLGKLLKDKYFI